MYKEDSPAILTLQVKTVEGLWAQTKELLGKYQYDKADANTRMRMKVYEGASGS